MKRSILAALVLAFFGLAGTANAAPLSQSSDIVTRSADIVQAQWGYDYHNRWRSHRRWGSGGGDWHNRWRSHRRWGSGGGGGGWHNRWRSHRRWGSGGY